MLFVGATESLFSENQHITCGHKAVSLLKYPCSNLLLPHIFIYTTLVYISWILPISRRCIVVKLRTNNLNLEMNDLVDFDSEVRGETTGIQLSHHADHYYTP